MQLRKLSTTKVFILKIVQYNLFFTADIDVMNIIKKHNCQLEFIWNRNQMKFSFSLSFMLDYGPPLHTENNQY